MPKMEHKSAKVDEKCDGECHGYVCHY